MTMLSPEVADLQKKILFLEDEVSSLQSKLTFRSSQVSDLETELAGRLLEIVRLKAENETLKGNPGAGASSYPPETDTRASRLTALPGFRPDLDDYEYLQWEFTQVSGLKFELEHVHDVLSKSSGLLAGVLQWGASDTCVRESLEEELREYLLGEDGARAAYRLSEDEVAAHLRKEGLDRGMQPADKEDED